MTLRCKSGFALALCFCLLSGLTIRAHAQAFTMLHSFAGSDGAGPWGDLIQASDGNLYGVTYFNGANNNGTIFKITTSGTFTVLYAFTGGADGGTPFAGLLQASDGNLYGTCHYGGTYSNGTIFKITLGGTLTTLHSFSPFSYPGNTDGYFPYGRLLQASDGNLYGTCYQGGVNGTGTVFKITTGGTFSVLHTFGATDSNDANSDGAVPQDGLIQASDGNLYGNTVIGGTNGCGTIFKITTGGTFTVLHTFTGGADGAFPEATLIQASDGNLYGTTNSGGANNNGTVFKITTGGTLTALYSFSALTNGSNADGANPRAGLIQASDGNLYGTTLGGGTYSNGTIFKITLGGTLTTLYSFSTLTWNGSQYVNTDGANPRAGLIQASDGNLYGTTLAGGATDGGTIFAFDLGSTTPTLSSLNPGSVNAGGPAFTLTLKGIDFSSSDSVHWIQGTNTNALTTTYVSASQLKASVPASLIASPGKATITIVTASGVASNNKSLTIKVTTLKLTSATLTKTSTGAYTASINMKNIGYLSASNVNLTSASLGPASTSTPLPVSLGSMAAGATTSTTLTFPGSAGSSGTVVTLKVAAKFTGGTFSGSLKVTLP